VTVVSTNHRAARAAALVALPIALLVGVLVFWLLGGFAGDGNARAHPSSARPPASGPVTVAAPALGEPAATVCRTLLTKLPDALSGRPRRPVTGGPAQNAAYGDPPIVLSCGAARPTVPQAAQLLVLNGVCWWPEQRTDRAVWTTVGREVPVQVAVPKAYEGPSQWVIDFAPAIASTVPLTASAPANC
jgi:hypothetical protein